VSFQLLLKLVESAAEFGVSGKDRAKPHEHANMPIDTCTARGLFRTLALLRFFA